MAIVHQTVPIKPHLHGVRSKGSIERLYQGLVEHQAANHTRLNRLSKDEVYKVHAVRPLPITLSSDARGVAIVQRTF